MKDRGIDALINDLQADTFLLWDRLVSSSACASPGEPTSSVSSVPPSDISTSAVRLLPFSYSSSIITLQLTPLFLPHLLLRIRHRSGLQRQRRLLPSRHSLLLPYRNASRSRPRPGPGGWCLDYLRLSRRRSPALFEEIRQNYPRVVQAVPGV
jgi:hypothetical protein